MMNRQPIALVTGASGAIGSAIANLLQAQGMHVVRHYCNTPVHNGLQADLRNETEIEALFHQTEQRLGGVDVLVNNAGIALPQQLITDTTTADFDHLFAIDVRAMFLCCRRALPHMIAQKQGRIINISSVWGVQGASCEVAYSAAKAAVVGLTKALAQEVAPSGITINCVAPGIINTPMNAHLDSAELAAQIPCGRLGTPEDVARAVAFFASEHAHYVTGQVLGVDGGFGM
ncbi:MAG: 3-oxoacyl-ACP reductase FabG [Oscillospiraceae bacterium]|nr:3-oxoacyl-ACP reductase FabG [Oscillospiraceae bacterium]